MRPITQTLLPSICLAFTIARAPAACAQPVDAANGVIAVHRSNPGDSVLQYRRSLKKSRPPLRGFRAPILNQAATPWPFDAPGTDAPLSIRRAAEIVGKKLARDGLLVTLAAVLESLGPASLPRESGELEAMLRTVGLPVDLFACFESSNNDLGDAGGIVHFVHRRLLEGMTTNDLREELAAVPFRFRKSKADFRVATESGEHAIGMVRLQLPSVNYWKGAGDGSGIDIARQLVAKLPDAEFIICIQQTHLDSFLATVSQWTIERSSRLAVIAAPLPVSQWAQDNGKPGLVGPPDRPHVATLVPRYAGIGEDGSVFVPGESFVADGLQAAGHTVIQSPLLFQGGNLMPVRDPATGERIMLVGEAEIYRNVALGLSRPQAVEAFESEFAVDRCVILPAVSFHIDFEVSVRAVSGNLVAFVNDEPAAVRLILAAGIDVLASMGTLPAVEARRAHDLLAAGNLEELLSMIGPSIARARSSDGYFPNSLAKHFSVGSRDSGSANLQRFMLAMDIVTAMIVHPADLPEDRASRAFMQSLRRRDADRRRLHDQLAALGWTVTPVPSLADEDRSINYLNGLHDAERYLIPAYGGLFDTLDRAAAAVFKKELQNRIAVIPVLCGESQRRLGALHCAVAAYPPTSPPG